MIRKIKPGLVKGHIDVWLRWCMHIKTRIPYELFVTNKHDGLNHMDMLDNSQKDG